MSEEDIWAIDLSLDQALQRSTDCFTRVQNKYYNRDGITIFDALHSCQYTAFLYFLSNSIYHADLARRTCDKIYALSKALSSADLFYEVDLPRIFTFDHPLGSVLGRAKYADYFSFSQGCTVGNNKNKYPRFGTSVFMMSNSKVLGDCTIGDDVIISAGAYLKDETIPSGSIVFGHSPTLTVKTGSRAYVRDHARNVFSYE